MKRVLKWSVPVDDQRHKMGAGQVVHVAFQDNPTVISVWTEEIDPSLQQIDVQVYGTGGIYPTNGVCVGTALHSRVKFVGHVVVFPDTRTNNW